MQQYLLTLFTDAQTVGNSQWLVNFVRIWNNQVEDLNSGNSVSEFSLSNEEGHTPPVFIEFPDRIDWNQLGNGVQTVDDLRIKVHVLIALVGSQDETMEQNLDALAIAQTIFTQFDEWMPETMTIGGVEQNIPVGVMNRVGEIQDKNHPQVYHFIQEYSTTWVDTSRKRPIGGRLSGAIELQIPIFLGTQEQNESSTATYYAADLVVKTNNTEAGRITSEGISSWKIPQASYGNTVTVTFTSTTEAKAVQFPVMIDTIGFYSVGDSLFYARYDGWYELIFTAPCDMSAGSGGSVDTWLNVNGSIVANSRHTIIVNSTLQQEFINAHKFYLSAGQYFKISSRADDTRCRFVYSAAAASPTRPARPSAEFIVTKISK